MAEWASEMGSEQEKDSSVLQKGRNDYKMVIFSVKDELWSV